MKLRRQMARLLCIMMILTVFAGCKSGSSDDKGRVSMGRYVEQKLELPDDLAGGYIISAFTNAENKLEVYVYQDTGIQSLIYTDGTWTKQDCSWLTSTELEGKYITDITMGKDLKYYVLTMDQFDEEGYSEIYWKDKDSVEKIAIPWLEKKHAVSDTEEQFPFVQKIDIMSNGNIVMADLLDDSIHVFDQSNGNDITDVTYIEPYTIDGDNIIGYSEEKQKLVSSDEKVSYTYDPKDMNTILQKSNDGLYQLNKQGISVMNNGGTIWQTVVDGGLTSLADVTLEYKSLCVIEKAQKEFAVLARNGSLFYYTYDANIPSVPEKQISIYSLFLNTTVQQAVVKYQTSHPNYQIRYSYALETPYPYVKESKENTIAQISEYVRTLNTELIAGNGADILLLDGLPKESYIEKGILEDISSVIQPMVDSNELNTNIMKNYITDSGCYYVPLRFQVPIIYGNNDVVKNSTSLDAMLEYVNKNPNDVIFQNIGSKDLARTFFGIYSKDIINEDNTLNETGLQNYLDLLSAIMNQGGELDYMFVGNGSTQVVNAIDLDDGFGYSARPDGENMGYIKQLQVLEDCVVPLHLEKKNGMVYNTLNHQYIESGLFGINKASKDKETAKDFLQYVLSEEIQSGNTMDGFPVATKELDALMTNEKALDGVSICSSTQDGKTLTYSTPEYEQVQELYEKMKTLDTPLSYDCTLSELIIEQAAKYLDGDQTKDEAIKNMTNTVSRYLAE